MSTLIKFVIVSSRDMNKGSMTKQYFRRLFAKSMKFEEKLRENNH